MSYKCKSQFHLNPIDRKEKIREFLTAPLIFALFFLIHSSGFCQSTIFPETTAYDVTVGIEMTATLNGQVIVAGTAIPAEWPEQKVEKISEETDGCRIKIRDYDGGKMMIATSSKLRNGQTATATMKFRVTVSKIEPILDDLSFEDDQPRVSTSIRKYLKSSPWIQSSDSVLRDLQKELTNKEAGTLENLQKYFQWVHREIEYREQDFTDAKTAVEKKIGDCEEKASVFIALCRSFGIPARMVWVSGHCWAEFYLIDSEGEGHWIPAHTSGNPWFGELKTTSVILQKGDSFNVKESKRPTTRLLNSWYRSNNRQPKAEFILEMNPIEDDLNSSDQD